MSRPILYATLAVLVAVLLGTSYALNKQTQPANPPQEQAAEMTPAKKAEMQKMMAEREKQMKVHEKEERTRMAAQMKKNAEQEKTKAAQLAALGIRKPKTSGVDISDKWFKETPDGTAGIEQAVREKQIEDKFTAASASARAAVAGSKPSAQVPQTP